MGMNLLNRIVIIIVIVIGNILPALKEIESQPINEMFSQEHESINVQFEKHLQRLYQELNLESELNFPVFKLAMTGFYNLKYESVIKNEDIFTIIDYSQPSTKQRLYIFDFKSNKVIYNSLVAHGKGTGQNIASYFSNRAGSLKSSLGFFLTQLTYQGKHGYTLKLKGLEPEINDNAEKRTIVIHAADYVSEEFIKKYGRLGRSWGCPALPVDKAKEIIDTIKDGSALFIYYEDENYLKKSNLLNIKKAFIQYEQEISQNGT